MDKKRIPIPKPGRPMPNQLFFLIHEVRIAGLRAEGLLNLEEGKDMAGYLDDLKKLGDRISDCAEDLMKDFGAGHCKD